MGLEGIGAKSSISYTDVTRQTMPKEPRAAAPQKAAAEPMKKTSVSAPSATTKGREIATTVAPEDENVSGKDVSSKVKDAIDKVNDKMRMAKTKCEFSYHEETKRVSIKVIDEETEEVIREIPPEETLEMLTKMWELAGILVDEKR